MAYFNNPRTEEELKNQFRQLLIKNDYRNPKNEKLISEIRKEYDQKLLDIKRANGYQTTGDKIAGFFEKVKANVEEKEREELREKQRIAQLQSRKYTKQELSELLNKEKRYIDQIIRICVREENVIYLSLKSKSKSNDYKMLYYFFLNNSLVLQNIVPDTQFNAVREEIEYAIDYLSGNRLQCEKVTTQFEITMGKMICESVIKYEEMYLDPIKIQETDRLYNKNKHEPRTLNQAIYMLLAMPAYILIAVMMLLYIVLQEEEMLLFSFLALCWVAFVELYFRLIVKPLEKKKNRVRTHKKAKEKESFIKGLSHLISSFFR